MEDDKKKIGLLQVIRHFEGAMKTMPITQEVIEEFCKREHIEPIPTPTELEDAIFQLQMDEAMQIMLPEFLKIASEHLVWTPDLSLKAKHDEEKEKKELVAKRLVQLAEEHAIPYFFVTHLFTFFENNIKGVFDTAQGIAKTRAKRVYEMVAREVFGHDDMTMADVAKYHQEKFSEEA